MKHNPGFLRIVEQMKRVVREQTVAEVKARLDKEERVYFVDVREDREFVEDHARGALHLGKGIIERDIEAVIPDKEAQIVLYCGGGYRSVLAAAVLLQMGYENVVSMEGGIRAWREAGYPLDQPASSSADATCLPGQTP